MPDAIVVGAGICGAATAHFLAAGGAEVLVIDRGGIGSGTTGLGEGNVLVCDKEPGPLRDLALRGRDLWPALAERFPAVPVVRKGALLLDHPEGVEVAELEPGLRPGLACLHEPDELQVDPRAMAAAMLDGTRLSLAEVAAVSAGGVRLAGGEELRADAVVVATGPWGDDLTGLPLRPRKGQLVALGAPLGLVRHKLIEVGYLDDAASTAEERSVATVIEQTLAGDEVLVGSSRESVGFDATVDPELTRAILDRAIGFFPALAELPIRRTWCGFRSWLPDGLPALGRNREGVWVNVGHEGSGVGIGPISGQLVAEAIAAGAAPSENPFDPDRFGP